MLPKNEPMLEEELEVDLSAGVLCTADELESFFSSNVCKQLRLEQATVLFEIRNNLEDPDAPNEDFQFQRGRAFEARTVMTRLEIRYTELKQQEQIEKELANDGTD